MMRRISHVGRHTGGDICHLRWFHMKLLHTN
jgi:hypothetical protein